MINDPLFIVVDLFCGFGGTTKGMEDAELPKRILADYTDFIRGELSAFHVGPNFKDEGFFKIAKVIACVNHDPKAIKSHWMNNPDVHHFEEDIRTLDLTELIKIVDHYRRKYPNALLILWASLECTNFSKAKGGQPRDADSRTLADHLDRYVVALNPDYIQIENVVEFMSWGPLTCKVTKTKDGYQKCDFHFVEVDEIQYSHDGHPQMVCDTDAEGMAVNVRPRTKKMWKAIFYGTPESKKNGQDWLRWRKLICSHGYVDQWKELNSANYGAYTSRNRLFGIFARPWLPIAFPEPTHSKNPTKHSMHGNDLKKWMPVKEVLDFSDEGESIFTRSKPLSDKTLERIYAGLIKYIAKGDKAFISKYFSGRPKGKVNSVSDPAPTVTTFGGNSLVQAKSYSDLSLEQPAGTVTTKDHHALVQTVPVSLLKYDSTDKTGKHYPPSLENPAPVIITQSRLGLIQAQFLAAYYGNGDNCSSVDSPSPTVVTKDRLALVQVDRLDKNEKNHVQVNCNCGNTWISDEETYLTQPCPKCSGFEGTVTFLVNYNHSSQHNDINEPAPSILTKDRFAKVHCDPFIMPTNYDNQPKSIDEPAPTITANRKHHYIVNPSHGGHSTSTEAPCPVIVARQDKAPLYLVQVENGPVAIEVYADDTEPMIRIKQFMAAYNLVDIKMRMLRVHELLKIQGFPAEYKIVGNQADQKKFIGNSVVPGVVKAWIESIAMRIIPMMGKIVDFKESNAA